MRMESTVHYLSEARRRKPRPAATSAAPSAATGSSGKPVRGRVCDDGSWAAGVVVADEDELGAGAGAGVGAGVVVVPDFFCCFGCEGTFENGSWYWLSPALSARATAGIDSASTEQATAIRRRRGTRDSYQKARLLMRPRSRRAPKRGRAAPAPRVPRLPAEPAARAPAACSASAGPPSRSSSPWRRGCLREAPPGAIRRRGG